MKLVILLPLGFFFSQVESRSVASEEYQWDMDYYQELVPPEVQPEDDLLPLDSHQEECIRELNLDREMMALLSTQEFPPEDDLKLNDFFSCSWKKQGYQHENGGINYESLEGMWLKFLREQIGTSSSGVALAKKLAETGVNDCRDVRGVSDGQTAVKVHNCIYRRLLTLAKEFRHLDLSKEVDRT